MRVLYGRKHCIFYGVRILVLLMIGTFVSAQQISSETIFDTARELSLSDCTLTPPDFGTSQPSYTHAATDTVEVYDIEIPEEDERNIYKEIAIYAIVTAAVGYFVYTLIKRDDEDVADSGGKEPPITPNISVSIPLTR